MEKEMKEIWKPVKGFEEYAEISNMGQIHKFERVIYFGTNHHSKRIQEETWTYGYVGGKGYLNVSIGNKKFRVHRLVYMTFVGEIPDGLEVNHIDENKHNNCVWNLNLMTRKENLNWGSRNAKASAALTNNPKISKSVQALDKDGNVVMEFPSTAEAQRQGFEQSSVSKCCNGKRKTAYGFIWRFAS